MKYRFSLASKGYEILCMCLSIAMLILSGVLIYYYRQIPWYGILFSCFISTICCVSCILCFTHRIVLDKRKGILILPNLKRKIVVLTDIENIEVDVTNSVDSNKYCFLMIYLKEGKQVKCAGFTSLIKKHDVQKTRLIVDEINQLL